MPNPDTAAVMPGRTGPPWTAEGTVYFYGGWLSNFAPTPVLRLPYGYAGHTERDKGPGPVGRTLVSSLQSTEPPRLRQRLGVRDAGWREARRPSAAAARGLGTGQVRGDAACAGGQICA